MKFTTQQIIDTGKLILSKSKPSTLNSECGKRFQTWLNDLQANPTAPNPALLKLYDFFEEAALTDPKFSKEIRHGLFKLLDIHEPKEMYGCIAFFIPPGERDLCVRSSFKKAMTTMVQAVDSIRDAEVTSSLGPHL